MSAQAMHIRRSEEVQLKASGPASHNQVQRVVQQRPVLSAAAGGEWERLAVSSRGFPPYVTLY